MTIYRYNTDRDSLQELGIFLFLPILQILKVVNELRFLEIALLGQN